MRYEWLDHDCSGHGPSKWHYGGECPMGFFARAACLACALLTAALFLIGCGSPQPPTTSGFVVKETGEGPGKRDTEFIGLNNCDGKAAAVQVAERGQVVQLSGGTSIGASSGVVSGAVSANYGSGASTSKSLQLTAPPGTNMEFTIEWAMEERAGIVTKEGVNADPAAYRHFRPVAVQIVRQQDLGCPGGQVAQVVATAMTPAPPPTARPSDTPPPTPSPKPTGTPIPPTPTPCPPGCVLYEADWSSGLNGWGASQGWKTLDGILVNDGTKGAWGKWIAGPYHPGAQKINNYAVEAEIQVVRSSGGGLACDDYVSFGIVARARADRTIEAYWVGIGWDAPWGGWVPTAHISANPLRRNFGGCKSALIEPVGFAPRNNWQTYRVEVKGNEVALFVDDELVAETKSNTYLEGGLVGLWSQRTELSVRSFAIIRR